MDRADWNKFSIDFVEQFCTDKRIGVLIHDGVIKGAVKEGKSHEPRS